MGRVIGRNNIYLAVMQCMKQGITVGSGFDRRIAFDQVSEAGIILFAKPSVVHTSLSRN